MRISAALPILLVMAPLPSVAQSTETHIDAVDFTVAAHARLGEHVTVDNCHLVFVTESEATCIGLSPNGAAGEVRVGRLMIRMTAVETPGVARALGLCDGGALDDACHVSVSGVVEDFSGTFGIAGEPMLGLREGAINWPD